MSIVLDLNVVGGEFGAIFMEYIDDIFDLVRVYSYVKDSYTLETLYP